MKLTICGNVWRVDVEQINIAHLCQIVSHWAFSLHNMYAVRRSQNLLLANRLVHNMYAVRRSQNSWQIGWLQHVRYSQNS